MQRYSKFNSILTALGLISIVVFTFYVWDSVTLVKVIGTSMEPTVLKGDILVVEKILTDEAMSRLSVGDIIAFYYQEDIYVKRVVGKENDIVHINTGIIYLNGTVLEEPYVVENDTYSGSYSVPKGMLFVVGDNRKVSNDSRYDLGYINVDKVIGKVHIFLSR